MLTSRSVPRSRDIAILCGRQTDKPITLPPAVHACRVIIVITVSCSWVQAHQYLRVSIQYNSQSQRSNHNMHVARDCVMCSMQYHMCHAVSAVLDSHVRQETLPASVL
jgi:hypothetical protein